MNRRLLLPATATAAALLAGLLTACSSGHRPHCSDDDFALAAAPASARPASRPRLSLRKKPAATHASAPRATATALRQPVPHATTGTAHPVSPGRPTAVVTTHVVVHHHDHHHHHGDDWCD
jgi:hypothetical protein